MSLYAIIHDNTLLTVVRHKVNNLESSVFIKELIVIHLTCHLVCDLMYYQQVIYWHNIR